MHRYHQKRVKLNQQREYFSSRKKKCLQQFFIAQIKSQLVDFERSQNKAIYAINERTSAT